MVLLTAEEVARHNKEGDCWLIIRGKVYDVSQYLDDHPGGVEVVTDVAGKDATEDYDDVGHSEEADEMMRDYYIGDLNGDTDDPNKSAEPFEKKQKEEVIVQQTEETPYLLYGGIAAAAVVVGFYILRR